MDSVLYCSVVQCMWYGYMIGLCMKCTPVCIVAWLVLIHTPCFAHLTDYRLHQWCVYFSTPSLRQCQLHQTRTSSRAIQSSDCKFSHVDSFVPGIEATISVQLRDTHLNEQEKAYQLKAQVIEVRHLIYCKISHLLSLSILLLLL